MKEKTNAERVVYENYSVVLQYYFNANNDFSPYISAGWGEALKDQDGDIKTAQVNAGFGLYYKLGAATRLATLLCDQVLCK